MRRFSLPSPIKNARRGLISIPESMIILFVFACAVALGIFAVRKIAAWLPSASTGTRDMLMIGLGVLIALIVIGFIKVFGAGDNDKPSKT